MNKFYTFAAGAVALVISSGATAQEVKPASFAYAGPTVGAVFNQGAALGVNGGYQVNRYFRVEGEYDHVFNLVPYALDQLAGNAIVQYPIAGTKVTPYVLAGMGYQWQNGVNQGIWNVGGGSRVEVNKGVDLDLRYRYVQGMTNQVNNNLVTLGTTFKF